jgi:trigger factor
MKAGMATDTEDIRISVDRPAAWARRLTITVPAARVARERRELLQGYSRRIRLPGFRKGRVPHSVVEKRFGQAIDQDLVERVIGRAYREALDREKLRPITDGAIDRIQYEPGTDLTFDVGVEVRPEIELARLGGFTVQRPPTTVADDQVDQVLERLREEHAVHAPLDEGAVPADGDAVAVEITPLDEVAGGGPGAPRTYEIALGQGHALPAVEAVIRTLRPGAEGEFTVDLPERPDEEGSPLRPHRIRVRMTSAKRPVLPALDDAFAASLGDFESLDALRARVREDLVREADREARRAMRHALISRILEANPFEVPASMVEQYVTRLVPDREGADPGRLAAVRDSARPAAEFAIRRMLVLERIAELESLAPQPADVEARVADIAARIGRPAAELMGRLRKDGRLAELEAEMLEERVFAYLEPLSTIEETT